MIFFHNFKMVLMLLIGLSGAAVSSVAFAASCTNYDGSNYAPIVGSRSAPRDIAIGSLVTPVIGLAAGPYRLVCTSDTSPDPEAYVSFTVASGVVPGFTDVYPTNLAGLGVRYNFANGLNSGNSCNMPYYQHIANSVLTLTCQLGSGSALIAGWGTSVEFVKTGPISAGLLTSIPAVTMSYSLSNQAGSRPLAPMYSGVVTGNIVVLTCTTPNVNVQMGKSNVSQFNGVGSKAPYVNFSLNIVNCPAGLNQITYQFSPAAGMTSSGNSIIGLSADSTASGIGISILDSANTPVQWNTPYTLAAYSASTGGSYSVALQAAYVQTGPITAGTVKSAITFTMTYL